MDLSSELRAGFARRWKQASRNMPLQVVLAFFLPVIAFLIATRFDPAGSAAIASVAANEADAVDTLSSMIRSGHVLSNVSAVREIFGRHMDVFFIGALPVGKISVDVFAFSVLCRMGACSLSLFMFLRQRIRTSAASSLLLALCYSTLPAALSYGVIPVIGNMMIMLPLVMYAEDYYLCENNKRSFLILTGALSLMIITGPFGVLAGLPFALGMGLIFTLCRTGSIRKILISMGGIIPALVLSLGLTTVVWLPGFYNGDMADSPESNKIRYTFFDMLSSMLDGKVPSSVSIAAPAFTLGIFVLMTVLLFFLNGVIPFRVKLTCLLFTVLTHVTLAVPAVDRYISVYPDRAFASSRLICLALLLIFVSAVSLRNIASSKETDVRISEFLILALIVITNSSANETSPSEFTLYFSAAAAVISGGLLLRFLRGSKVSLKVLCCLAVLGMGINLWHVAPKIIATSDSLSLYDSGNLAELSAELYDMQIPSEDLPLYGNSDDDSYLLITADLSYLEPDSIPDALNNASRAALMSSAYIRADYNIIYNHGISPYGTDLFTFDPEGGQCEMIIGADVEDSGRVIITSGLDARVFITESYTVSDRAYSYAGPFVYEFVPEESAFSIRYATTPAAVMNGSFSLWMIDDEALEALRTATETFDGKTIEGGGNNWMLTYAGTKSVITSVAYDPAIKATAGGRKADTYNYCGLLAILFESDGSGIMPEIRLTSDKGDLVIGAMVSTLSLGAVLGLIYINGSKKSKERSGAAT